MIIFCGDYEKGFVINVDFVTGKQFSTTPVFQNLIDPNLILGKKDFNLSTAL